MVGWSPAYDWTKEETERAINRALAEGRKSVNLDMEHSSRDGINRVMHWIREMGYEPFNNEQSESIRVDLETKRGDGK